MTDERSDRCPAGINAVRLSDAWERMTGVQLDLIEGIRSIVVELEHVRSDNARTRWLYVIVLAIVCTSMIGQTMMWSSMVDRLSNVSHPGR